jgi:hypothetical protein
MAFFSKNRMIAGIPRPFSSFWTLADRNARGDIGELKNNV